MRRGQVVPFAAPAQREIARDVALVSDRPVGVAAGIRRLAETVRLDPLADLAVLILRTAGLQVLLYRHVAVRPLSGDDPLGSDHTRVADVDHVRVADVVLGHAKARRE